MSYDLYFLRQRESAPLEAAEVLDHFARRPHYQVDRAAGQANYGNERTGVYFSFELSAREDDEPESAIDDGLVDAGVAFNLNYFRPHVFATEAEPEIAEFVRRFGLSVEDPQNEGMGRGPYRREGFLRGWEVGNRFAYQVIAQQTAEPIPTLPAAEIERIWQWNCQAAAIQAKYGDDIFVPRIMCGTHEGRVTTFAVWGDAIPFALPKVDWVVLVRQSLARRQLFGLLPGKPETIPLPFEALTELSAQAERMGDAAAGGHLLFREPVLMKRVKALFLSQQPAELPLAPLTMDTVLDEALLAEARQAPLRPWNPDEA